MRYYKFKKYSEFIAVDEAGNYFFYEKRSWLKNEWIQASWETTVDRLKYHIAEGGYVEVVSEVELHDLEIPLISPNLKHVCRQPKYDYRLNEDGDVVALGDKNMKWIYRDGWWEYVHDFNQNDIIKASNAVLRGQLLHEGDGAEIGKESILNYGARPLEMKNQICRRPDPQWVKFPLKEAIGKLNGRYFDFIMAVQRAYPFMKWFYPKYFKQYQENLIVLSDFKNSQQNDLFGPQFQKSIHSFVKEDKTGKLQLAIDAISTIHQLISDQEV